jgi:4-amino-4-deoxy-L-arabinose transferase-like glycosyltransferase
LAIIAILLLAFALRLFYINNFQHLPIDGDAAHYIRMAKRLILEGYYSYWGGHPDAFVTPGYPLFLTILLRLFWDTQELFPMRVYQVQLFFSVGTSLLIYLIGKRVANGFVGLLASLAFALYPTSIWATAHVLTETIYTFFFVLYAFLFLLAMEREDVRFSLAAGLALGITVAIRPSVAPLLVLPLLYSLLVTRLRHPLRTALLQAIGFALVLAPWWLRNLLTMGDLILFATQAGNPLLAGTDPYFTIGEQLFKNLDGVDQKALALERIRDGFSRDPYLWTAWFTVGKLRAMFHDLWVVPHGDYFDALQHVHQWSVYLGFAGFLLWKRRPALRTLVLLTVIPLAIQLLFLPLTRYAFPFMPLLMVLGASVVHLILKGRDPIPHEKGS